MFTIAICDDQTTICSQIESILLTYGKEEKRDIEIQVYDSGEELLKAVQSKNCPDLIFLDIELKLLNGVEVGKRIRDELKNEVVQIAYISSKQQYAMELFEVRPLHFLIKPLEETKIIDVLEKAQELLSKQNLFFEFNTGRDQYRIPYHQIVYFESAEKKVRIITDKGEYLFYGKLSEIEKETRDADFIRIHQSYLINHIYVSEYHRDSARMIPGLVLPISQTYRKTVNEALRKRREQKK